MAIVYATKTGNWSDSTVWNTGALPTSSDDVYANNFTVTINQNITVLSINTTSNTGVNAGGGFTITTGGINLSANINSGTTFCLSITHSSGIVTIVGSSSAGTVLNAYGISGNTSATINWTGNATAGTGQNTFGLYFLGTGTVNITGNVTGGSGTNANGIQNAGVGTVNITGNVTGNTNGTGISNASTGTVVITGNAVGGAGQPGAINQAGGTLRVTRAIPYASGLTVGVTGSSSSGVTVVKEIEFGTSGQVPVSGYVKFDNSTAIVAQVRRENNTNVTLTDVSNVANVVPSPSDVRSGVSYQSGSKVGTLAVPSAANVRVGVAVDNTVGTAALSPSDIWNYLLTAMTTAGSIGKLINDNLDAAVSSRLATSGYTAPTAVQVRQELDANSTKLSNLDATVSSRLAASGYTTPPSVVQIRQEMDANSTKLANLDDTVSSRLPSSGYTAPPTPPTANTIAAAVWSAVSRTLTSSPSATPEQVADAVWATLLDSIDTEDSIGNYLKNAATIASTGDQIAASQP